MREFLGKLIESQILNTMMNLHLMLKDPITLVLHGFIVLRRLLHLVVLLLLGLNFPSLNLPQIFLIFWNQCILQLNHVQITSVLTRLVYYYELQLAMEAGTGFGNIQLGSLLIATTILIIELVIIFVANGVILHH